MSMWKILDIDPTTDIKIIRRAYARQSRFCHPEEKPEAFKQLHRAYQQAMAAAENTAASPVMPLDQEFKQDQPRELKEHDEKLESPTTSPELDFGSLFAEAAHQRLEKAMQEGALKNIAERLRDPKLRNSKTDWKAFFCSEEYFIFHRQPDALSLILEYLEQQNDIPIDNLPRVFCVWLSMIAGIRYYEETANAGKMASLRPMIELLSCQNFAQYNQSEMKKAEYDNSRICFALFNNVIEKYPAFSDESDAAWKDLLMPWADNQYCCRRAGDDYYKILAFIVQHMPLPDSVRRLLYLEYDMDGFERSSRKNVLEPLYVALVEGNKSAFIQDIEEQKSLNQAASELVQQVSAVFQKYKLGNRESEDDIGAALLEMNALMEIPSYREIWFVPHFLKWFYNYHCIGAGRWSEGYWQLIMAIKALFEQNKEKPGVAELIKSININYERSMAARDEMLQKKPFVYFGLPDELSTPFTVLKDLDAIIQQRVDKFSYQDHLLMALFAMARTCVITDILSPISEKFERYSLRHIRQMPDYLLKWLMNEPVKSEDSSWEFIKGVINNMTTEVSFDGEDVKAVTSTPEIIFANYQSFLATWYDFSRFEYKPDDAVAKLGMTSGFILYPASMLIRMGYDADVLTALLNLEWQRIQDDIALLSRYKTYTELDERLKVYLKLNIFQ